MLFPARSVEQKLVFLLSILSKHRDNLALLYYHRITRVILPFIHWSEELGELLPIVSIKPIVFIDALSISDRFNYRDALIRLKCDDPQAQKRLWQQHIDRAPH